MGEGGKIWENGIEAYIISCMKRVASPGSMHSISLHCSLLRKLSYLSLYFSGPLCLFLLLTLGNFLFFSPSASFFFFLIYIFIFIFLTFILFLNFTILY